MQKGTWEGLSRLVTFKLKCPGGSSGDHVEVEILIYLVLEEAMEAALSNKLQNGLLFWSKDFECIPKAAPLDLGITGPSCYLTGKLHFRF